MVGFLFCSGRLQCQPVISVSPAKADRTQEQKRRGCARRGQPFLFLVRQHARPSGPVFRQKFTDKGWHEWIPARRRKQRHGTRAHEALKRQDPAVSVIGYDGRNREITERELCSTTTATRYRKGRLWSGGLSTTRG